MLTLLTIVHVIVCLFLIGIVLLQHGKGADIGASFGGSSQSLFGTEGPLPLLNKITTASAIIFMVTSVTLAYYSSHSGTDSVMQSATLGKPAQTEVVTPLAKEGVVLPPTAPAATPGESNAAPAATLPEKKVEPK